MQYTSAFLCAADGSTIPAMLNDKNENGMHAVFLRGTAETALDSDQGAVISLLPPAVLRWMADYRHNEFWCCPAFGRSLCEVPDETQGLILEHADGTFTVILPVVFEQYKCVLCGSENGLQARLFSWYEGLVSCDALAFVWTRGEDPFSLLERCAKESVHLLGNRCPTRQQREYPALFEYLGWCSWDAFEIRVSEEDLLAKCSEFKSKNIPVKWMILDDMWAEVHDFYNAAYENRDDMIDMMHRSRLYDFCADPIRFPNGLKHCLDKIKEFGIVPGIWHPTTGYWKGLDPQGPLYEKLKGFLFETADGRWIHAPQYEKAFGFYNALHDIAKQAGADFLKIDNQTMCRRFYKNEMPVGQAAREYHDAMEESVRAHFGNNLINCMGMGNEDMFNRKYSAVSRCSDDFLPENKAWFTKHILQCAYNSTIQGQFYFCDWDMWWTDDGQAVKNSILRAISGGPVYISDMLGRSRPEILKPLVFSDGRIARCDRPAMPTKDCLTADPTTSGKIFKLQTMCKNSGILAVFNLDQTEASVCGTVSPADIAWLQGEEFAVFEHFSKTLQILKPNERIPLTLNGNADYRLYIIVALQDGNCMIGDAEKFISPAAIRNDADEAVQLYEPGTLAQVKDRKLILTKTK